MARIIVNSFGTLGDHLPFVTLGQALQKGGHHVELAFPELMQSYAEKAGLRVRSCGIPWEKQQAQTKAKGWEHLDNNPEAKQSRHQINLGIIQTEFRVALADLLNLCQNADLLICGSQRSPLAQIVAEKLNILWAEVSLMPFSQSHSPDPVSAEVEDYIAAFNALRTEIGLPSFTPATWQDYWINNPKKAIQAASPYFSSLAEPHHRYHQTGFFFYENPDWQQWQPDRELEQFMGQDPKPLVLTFSSLPLADASKVLRTHIQAAAKLERGLVVQQGWADFKPSLLPDDVDISNVLFRGFIPQDWLFSQAAAVIHHGGIGTTARAIRNDCPMLVEPYGNDQFFNAKRVLALKIGTAIHPHRLTADGLAHVLQTKVLTAAYKNNVQRLSAKIRAENSVETACHVIESWL